VRAAPVVLEVDFVVRPVGSRRRDARRADADGLDRVALEVHLAGEQHDLLADPVRGVLAKQLGESLAVRLFAISGFSPDAKVMITFGSPPTFSRATPPIVTVNGAPFRSLARRNFDGYRSSKCMFTSLLVRQRLRSRLLRPMRTNS
jgi:hypothetical protein